MTRPTIQISAFKMSGDICIEGYGHNPVSTKAECYLVHAFVSAVAGAERWFGIYKMPYEIYAETESPRILVLPDGVRCSIIEDAEQAERDEEGSEWAVGIFEIIPSDELSSLMSLEHVEPIYQKLTVKVQECRREEEEEEAVVGVDVFLTSLSIIGAAVNAYNRNLTICVLSKDECELLGEEQAVPNYGHWEYPRYLIGFLLSDDEKYVIRHDFYGEFSRASNAKNAFQTADSQSWKILGFQCMPVDSLKNE